MKAVIASRFGSPDVLHIQEVAKPTPKDGEILIKVHATTVNVGDTRMRSFTVPPAFWLPARLTLGFTKPKNPIFGMELSGEVEAVGSGVTRFNVGDPVFGSTFKANFGAHAEYKTLPEDGVVALKPANLSHEQAASVPLGALTALYFLRQANIQPGQKVLVNGASGSVGSYAVQLAKHFGGKVTGVCSAKNMDLVKSLGADHIIDYTVTDFAKTGQTYDIIFEAVGKTTFWQVKDALVKGGCYLHMVMPTAALVGGWYAMTTGKHVLGGTYVETPEDLRFIAELLEVGTIKPVIDRCYPLDQVAEAHHHVDGGHKRGSVVIKII